MRQRNMIRYGRNFFMVVYFTAKAYNYAAYFFFLK